jgi:outer membrane protein, multidrug efflux system
MKKSARMILLVAIASLLFSACVCGPDYKKPDVSDLTPTDWRWKLATPSDAAPKGPWWKIYGDPALDKLETDALSGSETLKGALARVQQARAVARIGESYKLPTASASASYQHQRLSGNRPLPISTPLSIEPMNQDAHSVSLDASYELDLWGRIRRASESDAALAAASGADAENLRLTLTADVAITYFSIRAKDEEIASLDEAVRLREESAKILEERFEKELIPEIDASRAKTELASARADLAGARKNRAELFNALALLCGKAPANLEECESAPLVANPPAIPANAPATLLEYRPDVAAAERRLEAKCAQIGVARAAYFPSVNLIGSTGFLSTDANNLATSDSATWSIAPKVSVPLFTGGRTKAEATRAKAAYDEAVANYRQAVLAAFKDVEDALADIRFLAEQDAAQNEALKFALETEKLARQRYDAGYVDYLGVVDAERGVLAQKRAKSQIASLRYAASIRLIKALGGGMDDAAK